MKTRLTLGLCFVLALGAGCSKEQVYHGIQENRKLECQQLPSAEYERCMRQYDESYDAYRRSRDAAIEKQ